MEEDEFGIISRYFRHLSLSTEGVVLGPGDDCAVVAIPPGHQVCVSTDTLTEGVHFPIACAPEIVASRCLAANLSDLAAMGASPHSFLLALTLPEADGDWLREFAAALGDGSRHYAIPLVGGNLCKGPLSLTITVMGTVPVSGAILRSGANALDDVYVTGSLGDAGAGLAAYQSGERSGYLVDRYCAPSPRVGVGIALRGLATAMIDISDGLVAELGHIASESHVGIRAEAALLPLSEDLRCSADEAVCRSMALFAGDDYELCFTAQASSRSAIAQVANNLNLPLTRIGTVTTDAEQVCVVDEQGQALDLSVAGYRHF